MKPKKLRIGLFTDVYYPSISGVVVAVDTLRKTLEQQGHKVYVITMNNDPKSHKYIKKENCIKIPGIPTGIYDFSLRVLYPFKAVQMIKDLNLDIIHAHTEFGMGVFAKSMAKKLNIPLVATFHTMYEDEVNYVTKGLFPNTSKRLLKTYMKTYFSHTVKEIIVPSKKTQDFLKNKYHLKQKINILPNGIDTERFDQKKIKKETIARLRRIYELEKTDFIVMWVGRLGYEKRINILIEGFVDVVKSKPNAKLLIVGAGPDDEKLKKLACKLKIEDNVIFTGKISYDNVPNFYFLADVVATASHFETQGLTLAEAFGASTPVVCVNDPSFTNIVQTGYNGMIFRNKKEYTKIIKYLIDNPLKVKEMGNNAFVSSFNYNLSSFASKIIYIYERVLEEYSADNNNDKTN